MFGPLSPSPNCVGNRARSNAQYDDRMNASGALGIGAHVQRSVMTRSASGFTSVSASWRTMWSSGNTVNVDEPPEVCMAFVLHVEPPAKLQWVDQTTLSCTTTGPLICTWSSLVIGETP